MNPLASLPSFDTAEEAVADTLTAEEARAERIKFHRTHVRNGPVKFKEQTTGQAKRARNRVLKAMQKHARRTQIRDYLETRRTAAVVRGHLIQAGVLPRQDEQPVDAFRKVVSVAWINQRFGTETEVDGEPSGYVSTEHDDVLVALGQALEFVAKTFVLGDLQVPEDYVVPARELAA